MVATLPADCDYKDLHATIRISHALSMFVVTEAQAAVIRATYEQHGEFSAAVELRQTQGPALMICELPAVAKGCLPLCCRWATTLRRISSCSEKCGF
jgi:hypothetical protein